MELDIYPRDRPELSDDIEGSLGRYSHFDQTFGYHADGVGPDTALLPAGWESRLVPVCNDNTGGATGWCLECLTQPNIPPAIIALRSGET